MRYHGQAYELTIPCDEVLAGPGAEHPQRAVERLIASFHETHERSTAIIPTRSPLSSSTCGSRASARVPRGAWRERSRRVTSRTAAARCTSRARAGSTTPVLDRSRLELDEVYPGPMIVEQLDTTIWIPPRDVATVDEHGNIIVEVAL